LSASLSPKKEARWDVLTPADSQPDKPSLDEASLPTSVRFPRGKWSLTKEAYDKLLACFSPDEDEASKQLLIAYLKLVRFFEWQKCDSPDMCADKTIDRAARRIDQGERIENLMGYLLGIAKNVLMEWRKERDRAPLPLDSTERPSVEPPAEDEEHEARLRCLDICLEELPAEDRVVILGYYQEEKRTKINFRKQMADRLGVGLNALRIRAYRIRTRLEECVIKCLGQATQH
jgi:DNA-directed RNA polymerase specialized sigma24 family protein